MPKVTTIKDFIQNYCKISTKDGRLIDFKFNKAQERFYEEFKKVYGKKRPRFIVLKARQLGISTLTEALMFTLVITNFNSNGLIVAHEANATSNIFKMAVRYLENLPEDLKPSQRYSNAKELVFNNDSNTGLDSSIRVMTVGDGARSMSTRYLHLSEVGFWPKAEESMLAILQTVSNDNESLVVIESTANGFNYFYDLWNQAEKGESDYIPLFFPWYLEPSYSEKYDGFKLTDYECELKKLYKLTNEQIAWRRYAIKNLCGNDEHKFRQEYPISPEEAFVTSGRCVFDTESVYLRIKQLNQPLARGYFIHNFDGKKPTKIKWVDDPKGPISIFDYVDGNDNYCIGGDTSGDGSDYFAAHVISRKGKQVAVFHNQFDSDFFAKQMYCLGKYYNNALLTIEVNFDSYPIKKLQEWGYFNMYIREVNDVATKKLKKTYGFRTDAWTRPYILNQLIEIVKEHIEYINDANTLKEFLTFVRNDVGRMEAQQGAHDDLVMSLAIAYEGVKQVLPKRKKRKTIDY